MLERGQDYEQKDEDANSTISGVSGGSGYHEDATSDRDTDEELPFPFDDPEQEDRLSVKRSANLSLTESFFGFIDSPSDKAPSF